MIILYAFVILLCLFLLGFAIWFFVYKSMGKCPICALKKLMPKTKLTIDISERPDYEPQSSQMTPPMGWSSWNTFRQNISEDIILDTAKAMKDSGLLDAGYKYINLDDCWHSSLRDENGKLQSDFEKFPQGIPAMVEKINKLGFKLGLYTSNGEMTCEDLPASLGKEQLDADTFASWGCEFLKYDFCHHKFISGDAPAIEGIEISEIGKTAHVRLFCEDAVLSGKAKIIPNKKIPHKKAIGRLNHGAGSASFNVNVDREADYIFTLLFCKSKSIKDQYLQVIIGNDIHEIFFPKSKAFSPTGRAQLKIHLKKGKNTILITNPIVTNADSSYTQYMRMGRALKNAAYKTAEANNTKIKPITYSICEWGVSNPAVWGAKTGNLWRTTHDILPTWFSVRHIYNRTIKLYKFAKPGAFNDPDMLEVGNGNFTLDENKAHFSTWAMMAAPLILGNDIRSFVDEDSSESKSPILDILTNEKIIAIDQDKLGKPAKRIKWNLLADVIARPLENGDIAVCLFNKGPFSMKLSADINKLAKDEYLSFCVSSNYKIHEIWSGETFEDTKLSAHLKKHSCKVYRISNM